jgi:hypothetical protein
MRLETRRAEGRGQSRGDGIRYDEISCHHQTLIQRPTTQKA